ncbi:hypothetical protein ACT6QH_12825 [Xanthobacter sp. TB0139]|uniref:hypothetical protein n=1 Tax=Xanthobacter sp. TB0139 TaxID=3459178 RepID=UPI004039B7AF
MMFPGWRFHVRTVCWSGLLALALVFVLPFSAHAVAGESRMKRCGDEWSAVKAAGKVPASQSWKEFYAACSARLKKQDSAQQKRGEDGRRKPMAQASSSAGSAEAHRKSATSQKPGKKEPTPGQRAARQRQKKCGAEWREQKAAGKIQAGQKWPQFWSDCNARLKRSGQ